MSKSSVGASQTPQTFRRLQMEQNSDRLSQAGGREGEVPTRMTAEHPTAKPKVFAQVQTEIGVRLG